MFQLLSLPNLSRTSRNALFCASLFALVLAPLKLAAQPAGQQDTGPTAEDVEKRIPELDESMYTPFVELYLLEETKALRTEMQNTRAELIEKVVDKELSVADKTMSYATDTVTYFFYLIAGATSILVVIGWNSIRDMRNQLTSLAEKRVNELVVEYETRLKSIEEQLQQKSDIIHQNQAEIERTNEVHSLWLKASQETSQQNKIAAYDRILDLRPDDVEALSFKADAVLEMQEPLWAISLCQRAPAGSRERPRPLPARLRLRGNWPLGRCRHQPGQGHRDFRRVPG